MINQFPYTNFNEVNLDWLAEQDKNQNTALASLDSRVTALEAGGTSSGEDVYYCVYGATTNAEIEDALSNDMIPVCVYNDRLFVLSSRVSATYHVFFSGDQVQTRRLVVSSDIWSSDTTDLAAENSPNFTGTPTAPTPTQTDNSTRIATTKFVFDNLNPEKTRIDNVIESLENSNLNQHFHVNPFVVGTGIGQSRSIRTALTVLNNGNLKCERNSTSGTTSYGFYADIESNPSNSGHKIYISLSPLDITNATHFQHITIQTLNGSTSVTSENISDVSAKIERIITLPSVANRFSILLYPGSAVTNGEYFIISYIQFIDLTAMFGAGYEPSLTEFTTIYNSLPCDFRIPDYNTDTREAKTLILSAINNDNQSDYKNKGTLGSADSLDDVKDNSAHSVTTNSQPTNYPMGTRPGTVISTQLFNSASYVEQLAFPFYTHLSTLEDRHELALYFRRFQSTWSSWAYCKLTKRNKSGKYFAFGDSTTWGYSSDHSNAQSPWNYPALVGDLIGVDVHNVADPGQGLIKDWSTGTPGNAAVIPTINTMISDHDFDDTVLITVGWAYNDLSEYASLNFGNTNDPIPESTEGITTFLGYYAKILDVLQRAAPLAQVILITGFGSTTNTEGHKTDNQFTATRTFADGNKTIREIYNALEEMANYYGYPCINQAKGCAINYANGSNIIGDNIHPTYDNYRIYGNNIASRIVALFNNL